MHLLASAAAASRRGFPSRGLGSDVRLTAPDVLGVALVHREIAVHVAIFSRDQRRDAAFFSRPSTRMRQLRQVSQS